MDKIPAIHSTARALGGNEYLLSAVSTITVSHARDCALRLLRARISSIEIHDVWLPAIDQHRISCHRRIITHVASMKVSCPPRRPQLLELKHNAARAMVSTNGSDLPAINEADAVQREHSHERWGYAKTLNNQGSSDGTAVHKACFPALDQSTVVIGVKMREKVGAAPGYLVKICQQ